MMKFNNRMTPAELAKLTGYKPQTINRWIQQLNWQTEKLSGVKGGRAHMIIMSDEVQQFILSTRKMRQPVANNRAPRFSAQELPGCYNTAATTLERQLLDAVTIMTEAERQKLSDLLLREGITGLLRRLDISES